MPSGWYFPSMCGKRRSFEITPRSLHTWCDVLRTVRAPDHTTPDPSYERRTRYYARNVGPSRWLLVVVSYEQLPVRIVSAFANRKDPRSWSA